jgi:predicted dehydrogenase
MKELGVGIVGLGWVAGAHIETFKGVNGAGVKAVCSRRDLNPVELKAQFGLDLKVYGDLNDMIADPAVDIVDICTPHPYHPDQAVAAAEAGKHLIIEKPIAIDREGLAGFAMPSRKTASAPVSASNAVSANTSP